MGHVAAQAQMAEARTSGGQVPHQAPARRSGGTEAIIVLPGIAEALHRTGQAASVRKDATVIEAGSPADNIYRVTSGTLRIVQLLPDGRRHISSFLGAGDFFGFSELDEHTNSVETITDCTLIRYPRRQFEAILNSQADAGQQIFRLMCHQITVSNRMLLLLGRKTASERLASFLRVMVGPGEFRRGTLIYLPMNRADIADHLGLTIETVSRTVTQFRQRKLIELADRHQVVILDPGRLEELAGE